MTTRARIARDAAAGLGIGSCLGGLLLCLGQDYLGPEPAQGSVVLGYVIAMPLSVLLDFGCDWGLYAGQWTVFIAIVPAANGALLGTAAGFWTGVRRRRGFRVGSRR